MIKKLIKFIKLMSIKKKYNIDRQNIFYKKKKIDKVT